MTINDTLAFSWKNVKGNKLRTAITVIIMALGIFALILIITAIQAATNSLTTSFSTMGANAFTIRYKDQNNRIGRQRNTTSGIEKKSALKAKRSNEGLPLTFDQASTFKERFHFPGAIVSIALRGGIGIVANYGSKKTNPDVNIFGSDENYLEINGYNIQNGRNFTQTEINSGAPVCMIGSGVAEKLFPENPAKAVDKVINADHVPYKVIAVLEDKGSSAFFNTGRIVIIPYNNVRRMYATSRTSYTVSVMVKDLKRMDMAIGEATAIMRPIRGLPVTDENNFEIVKSDSIAESLLTNLGFLEKGTIGIALITLIGAAIGLMNIMLVAVNERTREIGLAKALGSTRRDIQLQFLFESIFISIMGAVAGIIAGILVGNLVAVLLKTGFVIPWAWVIIAIFVCTVTGLVAGLYPAYKASKFDPVVALRYE